MNESCNRPVVASESGLGCDTLRGGFSVPPQAEVLKAGGRGNTGNVTLLFKHMTPPLVLKVYRTLDSRGRELMRTFSNVALENKRGASPEQRRRTEQAALELWSREGFAVPAVVTRPLPGGIAGPALWLRYMDGIRLSDVLDDPAVAVDVKLGWIRRYANESSCRHQRAFDLREPLLVHEHPAACHVMLDGTRMITFDFENGYRSRCPVREGVASEVAGFLRTVARHLGDQAPAAIRAYAEGYADRERLGGLVQYYTEGCSCYRLAKRLADRRRRRVFGKTWAMQALRNALGQVATEDGHTIVDRQAPVKADPAGRLPFRLEGAFSSKAE